LRYKNNTTRGQHMVTIDGTQVGGTVDQYAKTSTYVSATLGNVTFSSAGPHSIVMAVTGKNSAATQFYITADTFTFVGQ
jgi:cyclophilin family peptidyl-prolyl cis-trans isomerase